MNVTQVTAQVTLGYPRNFTLLPVRHRFPSASCFLCDSRIGCHWANCTCIQFCMCR